MNPEPYTLIEIRGPADPLLLPWLDLYEISFPPAERIPTSRILNGLHEHARGVPNSRHVLAAVPVSSASLIPDRLVTDHAQTDQRILALLYTSDPPGSPAGFLWYFAVQPALRGQGLGAQLYRSVLDRLGPQVRALFFDVEDPRQMATPAEQELARRRLAFYRRMGARPLDGIEYIQRCAEYLPPLRLLLMVHPVKAVSPVEAYELAKEAMPEAVRQVGELSFG